MLAHMLCWIGIHQFVHVCYTRNASADVLDHEVCQRCRFKSFRSIDPALMKSSVKPPMSTAPSVGSSRPFTPAPIRVTAIESH
jgi:hypothetical protein